MAQKSDKYTYRVTWSEEDGEYVGLCAEFPSLSWLAHSPDAALRGIRKLVQDVVADMKKTHAIQTTFDGINKKNKTSWHKSIIDKNVTARFKKFGDLGENIAETLLLRAGFEQIINLKKKGETLNILI